ncbi:hypothetical protein NDU88_005029 [Pleurodeles waltl]|uniref:Uncharacterized protein n=1 Tax=Pleurodeles waltl TaxID=8319 RepID=A0AAV7SKI2_PLEWA|nr:hypothetical protein NDU88_005029 [Pleurodeles waltl]
MPKLLPWGGTVREGRRLQATCREKEARLPGILRSRRSETAASEAAERAGKEMPRLSDAQVRNALTERDEHRLVERAAVNARARRKNSSLKEGGGTGIKITRSGK